MATAKKPEVDVYAVRKLGRGFFLYKSEFGWRWDGTGKRTEMSREQADEMAAQLGGVVVAGPNWMPPGKSKPKRPTLSTERAAGEGPTRLERVLALVAAEDWDAALRLAAKLQVRHVGSDKLVLERAWEALTRPDFCRQLKRDPGDLRAAGIEALKRLVERSSALSKK